VSAPLPLVNALTQRTQQLCRGLERGDAEIFDLVTPVTAELLCWWFGDEACQSRALNFHDGQRQAILNTIVAHEVLDSPNLADLYTQVCGHALLEEARLAEMTQDPHAHPMYGLAMASGTGKTWVLQALLIWQFLNKSAALDQGRDDARFTRNFLIVTLGLIVYEHLLDVFLGQEIEGGGGRDFATSGIAACASLLAPPTQHARAQEFIRAHVCDTAQIGLKAAGNGMIAITHWHALAEAGQAQEPGAATAYFDAPAGPNAARAPPQPPTLPPGKARADALNGLDFLARLPELWVFNDQAHHIPEITGGNGHAPWQEGLSRMPDNKGRRFVQVDFLATPYRPPRSGEPPQWTYFPHIVANFDLKAAMRAGLVKTPVLDQRKEIRALPFDPLEFTALCDSSADPALSANQRVILRAGLKKLRKLEAGFARIDPDRHPKMLVICEDARVSPRVAQFLHDEGLTAGDVLSVDSGSNAELGEEEWARLRPRLFHLDQHTAPRVIINALMLHEGLDVNNICVIVPLHASQAPVLLEQTIGRGLRLMWRDPEYAEIKRENRERIHRAAAPGSLIDTLSIIEHPAFQHFYNEELGQDLVGNTGDDDVTSSTGDLIAAGLCASYERYDFAIPFVLREAGALEVRHRRLSEVSRLVMRESSSLPVDKCIYQRLAYPAHGGRLERAFIEWADADDSIQAFCKISGNRHNFLRLRHINENGICGYYIPDFLVRTDKAIFLVETQAQSQISPPNAQRNRKAALTWCEQINTLPEAMRNGRTWHYALVGELLEYVRMHPAAPTDAQGKLQ
jgi:type III restriction enzyme